MGPRGAVAGGRRNSPVVFRRPSRPRGHKELPGSTEPRVHRARRRIVATPGEFPRSLLDSRGQEAVKERLSSPRLRTRTRTPSTPCCKPVFRLRFLSGLTIPARLFRPADRRSARPDSRAARSIAVRPRRPSDSPPPLSLECASAALRTDEHLGPFHRRRGLSAMCTSPPPGVGAGQSYDRRWHATRCWVSGAVRRFHVSGREPHAPAFAMVARGPSAPGPRLRTPSGARRRPQVCGGRVRRDSTASRRRRVV